MQRGFHLCVSGYVALRTTAAQTASKPVSRKQRRRFVMRVFVRAGMPIGLQLMGRPWSEASLLYAGSVLESAVRPLIKMPGVSYDILSGSAS